MCESYFLQGKTNKTKTKENKLVLTSVEIYFYIYTSSLYKIIVCFVRSSYAYNVLDLSFIVLFICLLFVCFCFFLSLILVYAGTFKNIIVKYCRDAFTCK